MININRDTSVAVTAIVVIALFVSMNMYMETHDADGEYVRWGEVYSEPYVNQTTGQCEFSIDTIRGTETIFYDPVSKAITGNFTSDNRTVLLAGASITAIEVNRTHLKGLMVPSDVPVHTRAIFGVFINLQDDYECRVTVNGIGAEWDNLGMKGNMLIIGLDFDSAGVSEVVVIIGTENINYSLGWTVNVG